MMMKFKMQVPIYDQPIHIYIVDDVEDAFENNKSIRTILKKEGVKTAKEASSRAIILEEDRFGIIFGKEGLKEDIISHEVFHLTLIIMKHVGRELSDENEENYAYLNGYLNAKIRSRITGSKKRKTKKDDEQGSRNQDQREAIL